MICHVVTFQFKQDFADRAEAARRLDSALSPLAGTIPGVRALRVGFDDATVAGHWDATLISLHDSKEDLAAYQVHPAHQAALQVVGAVVSQKSTVDFEIANAELADELQRLANQVTA